MSDNDRLPKRAILQKLQGAQGRMKELKFGDDDLEYDRRMVLRTLEQMEEKVRDHFR